MCFCDTVVSEMEAGGGYNRGNSLYWGGRRKAMNEISRAQIDIATVCDEIKELLLGKNRKYGDSALNPVRVFSKCSSEEAILVRLDDKLSRIRTQSIDEDEDVLTDLIGYLVLLKIALKRK
jgi:hypothetical protein